MRIFFSLILLITLASSCYEPEEGCLDRSATNFTLDADESCSDCCTYPTLKIQFNNKWQFPDTLAGFSTDSVFLDDFDQAFRIKRIRYYWSNYALDKFDGSQIRVIDLLEIAVPDGSDTSRITISDHFLLADITNSTTYLTLGTVQPTGTITGLSTDLGMARPANSTVTTELDEKHPLAPQEGGMNFGSEVGYVFAKIELFRDTIAADTIPITVDIFGDQALRSLNLSLPVPTTLVDGFNPQLIIETDFAQWFEGVNVRTDDTMSMANRIIDNIVTSFTLKEVVAN